MKRKRWMYVAPLALVGFVGFIALGGWIVRELWNYLFPALFGWREIGFWQALGLLALCRILFGRFGPSGFSRSRFRRRMDGRWERMTPEERERVRQGLMGRCGFAPRSGDDPGPSPVA